MNIFKKMAQGLGFIPENPTEEIMEVREARKKELSQTLKNIGFSDDEVNEVLQILINSEQEIQKLKDSLIGTNINNPDPGIIMNQVFKEIRSLEIKTGEDLKAKIAEIRTRKGI